MDNIIGDSYSISFTYRLCQSILEESKLGMQELTPYKTWQNALSKHLA